MTAYSRIKLKHALLKKDLYVIIGTIAGYHYSDASKATHVYTTAGVFPCEETDEQIGQLIDAKTAPKQQKSLDEQATDLAIEGFREMQERQKTVTAPITETSTGATNRAEAQKEP